MAAAYLWPFVWRFCLAAAFGCTVFRSGLLAFDFVFDVAFMITFGGDKSFICGSEGLHCLLGLFATAGRGEAHRGAFVLLATVFLALNFGIAPFSATACTLPGSSAPRADASGRSAAILALAARTNWNRELVLARDGREVLEAAGDI